METWSSLHISVLVQIEGHTLDFLSTFPEIKVVVSEEIILYLYACSESFC